MDILGKIFKQTFWQIIGKAVTAASTFIILGIIARSYHEKGLGVFTLALTYLAIFNLLSDFGFNAHVLKQTDIMWNKLLGTRLLWSGMLIVTAVILLPFLPFATKEFSQAVIFGSLAIIGSSIFISCNLIFQSKHRYDLSVISSSLGTLVGLGLYLWLSSQSVPIPLLLTAYCVSWLIIAVCSLLLVKRFLNSLFPIYDIRYTINLFKDTWPIAAALALNVVYFRVDSFMISFYKGVSDVGIYNVAYSVFQSALVLPTFIMNAYYPLMLKSLSKIKLMTTALLVLASLGTVIIYFFSSQIVEIITGTGFLGSSQSLQILSLSFPAFFLSSFLMWFLITKGQYKKMLIIYTAGLIFNFILNLAYIPKYSFLAASWVTVISEYLILLLQLVSL